MENRQPCWRMVSKIRVFFMLPILFRGISTLVDPLTKLAYGLRLLLGRVVCEKQRRDKG